MENAVEIKDISMRFNLAKERVDNIKEWVVRKLKGKGVSYMENQAEWHGTAPNAEQYRTAMKELSQEVPQ